MRTIAASHRLTSASEVGCIRWASVTAIHRRPACRISSNSDATVSLTGSAMWCGTTTLEHRDARAICTTAATSTCRRDSASTVEVPRWRTDVPGRKCASGSDSIGSTRMSVEVEV